MKFAKSYDDFKSLAVDSKLSKYEKISFPDVCRQGFEEFIFLDIKSKLDALTKQNKNILDIGCGCSDLPSLIVNNCIENNSKVTLIDSAEMLHFIKDENCVNKVCGFFPNIENLKALENSFDAIICYSVIHYMFNETSFIKTIDIMMSLLRDNGQLLIGDIPNISKSKRFFSGQTSLTYSNPLLNGEERKNIHYNKIAYQEIDDSVVFSIVHRARLAGFNAYIIPQNKNLFTTNFREDILIEKV